MSRCAHDLAGFITAEIVGIDVSPAENKPIINANMATLFDYVHTSTHTVF
jgi:hypothetical protein